VFRLYYDLAIDMSVSASQDVIFTCAQCKKHLSNTECAGVREEDLGESWMNLTESVALAFPPLKKENSLSNIHAEVERNRKMREVVHNDFDQAVPVCDACTNRIVSELVEAKNQAAKEAQMFSDELNRLLALREEKDDAKLEESLRLAEEEEALLLEKSNNLESEKAALRRTMAELHEHAEVLEQLHKNYWRDYNELQLQLRSNERESLRRKIDFASQQLEALNKTNVINDAFYISHTDLYGTINGFRLGSIQSQPVEWDEINAAWGQTSLVLQTLATHCDFTFPKYRLVPMGSLSRIIRRDDEIVLDLHCPSDISFGRLFGYGTFDKVIPRTLAVHSQISLN
jgi:beclin